MRSAALVTALVAFAAAATSKAEATTKSTAASFVVPPPPPSTSAGAASASARHRRRTYPPSHRSSSSSSVLLRPVPPPLRPLPPLSAAFRGPKSSSSSSSSSGGGGGRRRRIDESDFYSDGDDDFDDDDSSADYCHGFDGDDDDADGYHTAAAKTSTTTSGEYALDPYSPQARARTASLGLSPSQHSSLIELSELVVEWNDRINLVSRRDCDVNVVFGRHVLPSATLCRVPDFPLGRPSDDDDDDDVEEEEGRMTKTRRRRRRAVDVGTGGGFPGLPLAICYPEADFVLVDSVGKKLGAVRSMAEELGLTNVETHHGRVEEMTDDTAGRSEHGGTYDLCLGRSVAALPKFCFWVQELLKRRGGGGGDDDEDEDEGVLVYIIGGDVEESVTSRVRHDVPLDDLLLVDVNDVGAEEDGDGGILASASTSMSDKRALVLRASDVARIASESGEVRRKRNPPGTGRKGRRSNPRRKKREARGEWSERRKGRSGSGDDYDDDDDRLRQRGYENFKRYES